MATYAVIENGSVVNVILADSKEIAEEVTQKECLEVTEENPIGIGWEWKNEFNKYVGPAPFASWVYDGDKWNAPIPMPEDGKIYGWNEEELAWVEFIVPIEGEIVP